MLPVWPLLLQLGLPPPAGVDASLVYDAFGRTTTLPGYGGAEGTTPTTIDYYTSDLVRSETQGTTTRAWGLDADGRFGTWTDTVAGSTTATKTNHYDDGSEDSPDWIAENADSTQWTANVSSLLGGLGLTVTQDGTATYQYTNLHGDITCTATPTDTTPTIGPDYDEYGNPSDQTPRRYGWLGGKQRSSDSLAGLTLMGVRLYNPTLGRFLSTDPEPGGSANDYDYCNADPINCTDLDGRIAIAALLILLPPEVMAAVGGVIVGLAAAYVIYSIWHGTRRARKKFVSKVMGIYRALSKNHRIHKSRKRAYENAKRRGKGEPILHGPHKNSPHKLPHYHPADKSGRKIPGSHEYFPRRRY